MTSSSTNNEIIAVERRWVQAHLDLDFDILDEIMAEDYFQIRADGTVGDKNQTLASYQSGNRTWEIARSDEYDIRMLDDTALLIGRWTGRGVAYGESFDYQARFLAVYTKISGEWKLLADQATPLNPE